MLIYLLLNNSFLQDALIIFYSLLFNRSEKKTDSVFLFTQKPTFSSLWTALTLNSFLGQQMIYMEVRSKVNYQLHANIMSFYKVSLKWY